jgi:hypothetical protein
MKNEMLIARCVQCQGVTITNTRYIGRHNVGCLFRNLVEIIG